jgi:hypothetical protein
MPELGEWDSFYMIVGSAAGALVGLQFVVMTLISERPPLHTKDASAAFATPTVVHFSVALFLSAAIRAPWRTMTSVAALWGVVALGGIVYTAIVVRRMRAQSAYKPVFEDWLFHVGLPLASYAALGVSAFFALSQSRLALFGAAGSALLLLFLGIHNAWDAVVYNVLTKERPRKTAGR